jgi:hypothetical protein
VTGGAAAGDILVDNVTAADTITLVSGGAIEETGTEGGDPADDLTAMHLDLTAAGGIGAADTLEVDGQTLSAEVLGSGNIDIADSTGGLYITHAVTPDGAITLMTLDGDMQLGEVGASDTVTATSAGAIRQDVDSRVIAGDALTFTAGTGILIGYAQAGTTATLVAGTALAAGDLGGSILDGNDVMGPALNIKTGGNAYLDATGVIGTLYNPIEVEIGGNVYASAGGSLNGVSIALTGTTGTGEPILPIGPGAILFGGFEHDFWLRQVRSSINPLLDERRRFDRILHYPLLDSAIDVPFPFRDETQKKAPEPGPVKPPAPPGGETPKNP